MSEREWKPIETAPDGDHNAVIDLWAQGLRYTDCQWGQPTYGRKKGVYGGNVIFYKPTIIPGIGVDP